VIQFAFTLFAKSFAYFAVKRERRKKTAKIAKQDAKFRKEKQLSVKLHQYPK
jgi:hypothetical protein